MLRVLSELVDTLAKFFAGIFVRGNVSPSPEPVPPPVPIPPPPVPAPVPTPLPPPPVPAPAPPRTRPWLMRDSTNGFDIPQGTEIVAGYINGLYMWTPTMWARFVNSYQLTISITASANAGNVLDVETGDATPAQAPAWVAMRRAAGHDPWIYVQESRWADVIAAFNAHHMPQPHYWIAWWGHGPNIPPGAFAIQYANPTLTHAHYDESIVSPSFNGAQR